MNRILSNDGTHGSSNHGNLVTETTVDGLSKGEIERIGSQKISISQAETAGEVVVPALLAGRIR
jgi:hypothetical protein